MRLPLMYMRGKGMTGSLLTRHANSPAGILSKSIGGAAQLLPPFVTLGDGWRADGFRAYSYQAGTDANPVLAIAPIIAGRTYTISGFIPKFVEIIPTAQIHIRVGSNTVNHLTLTVADLGSSFKLTQVAAADNTEVRFVVDSNLTVQTFGVNSLAIQET